MRIAILTLPLHTNYGGILQAFALQTVLENLGHEVVVLNKKRRHKINWFIYPVLIAKRIVGRFILNRHKITILYEIKENRERDIIEKNTECFINEHIKSHYYKNISDLEQLNYEAIVVGSDQVWSKIHAGNICGSVINAFLPFTIGKQMKRITYAASFGKDFWEYSDTETIKCRELVKHFESISVREVSAVELCRKYLYARAKCHIDPTLLLDADYYIKKLKIKNIPQSKGNLLLYIIDYNKEKREIVNTISTQLQLTPFEVNSRAEDMSGINFTLEQKIQPPVEQWLRGFYDAEYVVTDSFHACIFSILFKKPFIVIGNKQRGLTRFDSLLALFKLESRLIEHVYQLSTDLILSPINWEDVTNRLAYFRTESMNYLKESL